MCKANNTFEDKFLSANVITLTSNIFPFSRFFFQFFFLFLKKKTEKPEKTNIALVTYVAMVFGQPSTALSLPHN